DGKESGLLVTLKRKGAPEIAKEISLPVISQDNPHYNHPGGCQVIGDCLIIPMETEALQHAASAVCFFDISDPTNVVEINQTNRIMRGNSRGGAAGITNFSKAGHDFWLVCVYNHDGGLPSADFYISGADSFLGSYTQINHSAIVLKDNDKDTDFQAVCLLTD